MESDEFEGRGIIVISAILLSGLLLAVMLYTLTAGLTYPAYAKTNQPLNDAQANNEPLAESVSTCRVSTRFSDGIRQWCELITYYSDVHDFDPDLVAALILQESGGDPSAYSHSGAVGLMQVMPRDGLAKSFMCANGPCFADRPEKVELFDPEFNIAYGTNMLADLVTRRGSLRDALKSYGPMDVGYSYSEKVLAIYERYRD